MNTREFDQMKIAESAVAIKEGNLPLLRASTPTYFGRLDDLVRVSLNPQKKLVVSHVASKVGLHFSDLNFNIKESTVLSVSQLATLVTKSSVVSVMFDDRLTLNVALRNLRASNRHHVYLARAIEYLANQPAISRVCVLTELLAQKYWLPGNSRTNTIYEVAELLGLNRNSNNLVIRAADGQLRAIPNANFHTSGSMIADGILGKTRTPKHEIFSSLQGHVDLWESVQGSDPLLVERFMLTGSTVRITPIVIEATRVVCRAQMPFKLRPGRNVMVFGGSFVQGLPLKMESLDFDSASGELVAAFSAHSDNKTRSTPKGYYVLADRTNIGKDFYAINMPFTGGNRFPKGTPARLEQRQRPDIPLDVLMAGAAS